MRVKAMLQLFTILWVGLVLVTPVRPAQGQLLIDDFKTTTSFAFGTLDNPSVGAASNYTFTSTLDDVSATSLGGVRHIGTALAIASQPASSATIDFTGGVHGGVWESGVGITTFTGSGDLFGTVGMYWGGLTSISPLTIADYTAFDAETVIQAVSDHSFLADFTGATGLRIDAGLLTFTWLGMGLIDTSGHDIGLVIPATGPGPGTADIPFFAFAHGGFTGYTGGVSGAFDWAHVSGISIEVGMPFDGSVMQIDNLSTFTSSTVPEGSSIAMLALGSLPIIGMLIRRRTRS